MRAVIQRVLESSVVVNNNIITQIGEGLLVFVGIEVQDKEEDVTWLANKIVSLRIFADDKDVMNRSLIDSRKEILVVSQFTLHAKTKKGNRPSYIKAAKSDQALFLYNLFNKKLSSLLSAENVKSGRFGADMKIGLVNDGPVTIIIDTKSKE